MNLRIINESEEHSFLHVNLSTLPVHLFSYCGLSIYMYNVTTSQQHLYMEYIPIFHLIRYSRECDIYYDVLATNKNAI
jgi:hypothetical protein